MVSKKGNEALHINIRHHNCNVGFDVVSTHPERGDSIRYSGSLWFSGAHDGPQVYANVYDRAELSDNPLLASRGVIASDLERNMLPFERVFTKGLPEFLSQITCGLDYPVPADTPAFLIWDGNPADNSCLVDPPRLIEWKEGP